jgi:hypothetical protein
MPKYGVVMLKTWVQAVATHFQTVGQLVGLYPHFLPTKIYAVCKWVDLYDFNPQQYRLVFPTHFWRFNSVKFGLSTLSTPPIMNSNYVKRINNKGAAWV